MVIWKGTLHLLPFIYIQFNLRQNTDGLVVVIVFSKRHSQAFDYHASQHILPQKLKTKPHIYTDCTDFRRCIENENKLVKQTEIVAKCIAIIWWLQQQTNKQNKQTVRAL